MKQIIIYIAVMLVVLVGCEKEPYDRFTNEYSAEDITRLVLSTNTTHLFANGTAEVEFTIDAYFTKDLSVKTVVGIEVVDTIYKDSEVKYKTRNIPEGIEIFSADGEKIEDFTFSTTDVSTGSMEFYAKALDVESPAVSVIVEEAPSEDFEEVVIPIVFHMVETDDYKSMFKSFDQEKVAGIINQLNSAFSNTAKANAPHSVDLKVRFELATINPLGKELEEAGINWVQLGDVATDEAYTYVKENLMWDHNSYLNIWICQWNDWAYWEDPLTSSPSHITTDPTILPGLNMVQVAEGDPIEVTDPADIGIMYAPQHFSEGEVIITSIGKFLGLLPTRYFVPNWWEPPLIIVDDDVDYCADTYTHRDAIDIWKTTYPNDLTIKSVNIMDEETIGSVVSYHQGQRVRNVLEYCPLRSWGN
ncbi:hypothetical protein [Saccharicrinis sp. GN24d3]|uniref:hypothetical protein n=1 Tax=Saccharicrinis sp. GN24d3 TaxID=3458416 RepID=UPI004035DF7F